MRFAHFLALAPLIMLSASTASAADLHPGALAGVYDGGQIEIAAQLELAKDGRFRYALSYGALDEAAAGSWSASGEMVTLVVQQYESSDPSSDGRFGPSILKIEDGALILPRYDRLLRFRRMK
jgi:hypothetical protein